MVLWHPLKGSVPMGTSCMKNYKTYGQMKFFVCVHSLFLSPSLKFKVHCPHFQDMESPVILGFAFLMSKVKLKIV